ncbi:BID domain-containing T4SS effector [Bartonella heixiaziensis]|uniref:BID domain-containing T4SS effector n=1 Tax=Bartonella heixiaziensis TaxID=1461000 RepID=UPI0039089BC4
MNNQHNKVQSTENQQKLPKPEKEMESLLHKEIATRVQKDPSVLYAQAEVQYWCQIVYGNPFILREKIEEVRKNPAMGEELSWQVANDPTFFSKLAGHQMFGIKNSTRKKAEEGLHTLCNSIENYAETVKQVRESIVQTHQAQQNCQRQSSELTQDLQKQQNLSSPSKLPEQTIRLHNEVAEASRQEEQRLPAVLPRKVEAAKAIAFASSVCISFGFSFDHLNGNCAKEYCAISQQCFTKYSHHLTLIIDKIKNRNDYNP